MEPMIAKLGNFTLTLGEALQSYTALIGIDETTRAVTVTGTKRDVIKRTSPTSRRISKALQLRSRKPLLKRDFKENLTNHTKDGVGSVVVQSESKDDVF